MHHELRASLGPPAFKTRACSSKTLMGASSSENLCHPAPIPSPAREPPDDPLTPSPLHPHPPAERRGCLWRAAQTEGPGRRVAKTCNPQQATHKQCRRSFVRRSRVLRACPSCSLPPPSPPAGSSPGPGTRPTRPRFIRRRSLGHPEASRLVLFGSIRHLGQGPGRASCCRASQACATSRGRTCGRRLPPPRSP